MIQNDDVQFDTDQYTTYTTRPKKTNSLTDKLVNLGIAKNEKQALSILISVIVVSLLITFWVIFLHSPNTGAYIPTSSDVIRENGIPPRLKQPVL